MHFRRARQTHHLNDLFGCRAAHNGIINQYDPFALNAFAVGVVFQFYAQMSNFLGWFDKSAPDIVVSDNADFERNIGRLRIADS